jgi:hypothetical protein
MTALFYGNALTSMKNFYLYRLVDKSEISGTGIVAEGVVFSNKKCALTWLSAFPSVTIFDDIEALRAVHGHEGLTQIVFEEDVMQPVRTDLDCGQQPQLLAHR